MKIQCPSCDQRLEIPEELAGQTIGCPACNESLDVPSLATPPPSPVQVQQSAPQVTASEKPKSSIPKWAIASVAGIAVLVVCLIMYFPNAPNGVSSSEPTAVKTDGESQQSTTAAEAKPIERVAGAKAPDISIHEAASEGNIEVVKQHLAAGTDVNAKANDPSGIKGLHGSTPLHEAVDRGHKEIAEVLITNGADVNAKMNGGASPLDYAAGGGHKEIAQLLIAKGADVNGDKTRFTPLDEATLSKQTETAELLRKHGGKSGAEFSIHVAAELGNTESVKQHLAAGADVNSSDKFGRRPLELAIGIDHTAITELLIINGANINARNENGLTALNLANLHFNNEIADLLRKHGGKTMKELKAEGK